MDLSGILASIAQLTLLVGPGAVFLLNFALRDIFIREQGSPTLSKRFADEYEELRWLMDKRQNGLNAEERRRFYKLRQMWTEMNLVGQTVSMASGSYSTSFSN